ncbi:TetR/AcrR family transcriptional regulator [Streptomyces fradiae]|uniref:TetR/AcrR family transcriptional regulator n=1 Tax=Streptomyces fradiae TaxID=1906 RepID=UPI00398691F3
MEKTSPERASRRERLRVELVRDARREARTLLAAKGVGGLSVSEVARRVGVSPPALYRYFDGKAGLVGALYDDLTEEVVTELTAAAQRQDPDDVSAQLHAATRAVLHWSVANRIEFGLLMGATYPEITEGGVDLSRNFSHAVGGVFGLMFTRLWESGQLKFRDDDDIPPELLRQLTSYRDSIGLDLPLGVLLLMITCWRQIYGTISMVVHEHLSFAFEDGRPLFEDMMDSLLALLGLTRSPRLR